MGYLTHTVLINVLNANEVLVKGVSYGVTNDRQLECCFNRLFKIFLKIPNIGNLWRESSDWCFSPHRRPVIWNASELKVTFE